MNENIKQRPLTKEDCISHPDIKISDKIEDYKIYVELENGSYFSCDFIKHSERSLSKKIQFDINLKEDKDSKDETLSILITRKQLKSLAILINETVKYL